jgi:WD40 repeat protein
MNPLTSPTPDPQVALLPAAVLRAFGTPRFHTDGDVAAVQYAADGTLWSVEETGVLRHWGADGQSLARSFLSDLETLWTFSPDAVWLASASDDLILWETATGQLLDRFPQASWVTAVTFSADRSLIATGHDDGSVRVWDAASRHAVAELPRHGGPVSALAFHPGNQLLASAGEDLLIQLWDLATKQVRTTLRGHTDRIPAMAWHPDGRILVSAGWDTTARVWDTQTAEPMVLLNSHAEQVVALAMSPDGKLLACADSDNAIHVWNDLTGAKTLKVLSGHAGEVRTLSFRPDGQRLASAGADQSIHVWDPRSGQLLAGQHTEGRTALAVVPAPSGLRLASTCGGTLLQVWDAATGQAVPPTNEAGADQALAASPDGRFLATGGADTKVRVWSPADGQLLGALEGQRGPVAALAFASDNRKLASGCATDGTVWVWVADNKEVILLIPEAADGCSVEALAWHPSGKQLACGGIDYLATSGSDGAISIWDMVEKQRVGGFPSGVVSLAYHPSGDRLAGASLQEVVLVWDLTAPDREPLSLAGHHDRVTAVAYSPDGKHLASAGDDRSVRLWDGATGAALGARLLDTPVQALAFAPDGRTLFTGNGNTTSYAISVNALLDS